MKAYVKFCPQSVLKRVGEKKDKIHGASKNALQRK